MAVGWWTIEPENSLAMLWNGSSWTMKTVPDSSDTDDNFLNSISCVTTSFSIAVGDADRQVIDKWNGTSWSIVSTTVSRALNWVRCRSTSFCIAVGAQGNSVEDWIGEAWAVVPSPNPSSTADGISSVSCTTATGGGNFCLAVGSEAGLTLVEKYS
jgi:hypothetical protein